MALTIFMTLIFHGFMDLQFLGQRSSRNQTLVCGIAQVRSSHNLT